MTADVPHNFANPAVVTQSWYVAVRSRDVRAGQIASYTLLNRRIAIYRDRSGVVHALDARCPHLGADLGQGCLVDDEVQCAFHKWKSGLGQCSEASEFSRPLYGSAWRTRRMQDQTVVFLPKEVGMKPLQALALLYFLLHRDRGVLERLDFHPAFAADDEPLRLLSD